MAVTTKSPLATFRAVGSPAAAAQATVSQAAQSAPTSPPASNFTPWMVVTGIACSVAAGGTAIPPIKWNLIDGTSGGTNVQMAGVLSAPINQAANLALNDLYIPITSGTATLEFASAPPAAAQEVVSIFGFHVNYGDV